MHVIRLNETSGPEPVLALESVPGRFSFSDPIWLSEYTFAYINRTNADVAVWSRDLHHTGHHGLALAEPRHLLDFPTGSSPSSLKFLSDKKSASKASSGVLAFSAHVWLGHDIEDTQRLEEEYANRGDDAMIWDELFIRYVRIFLGFDLALMSSSENGTLGGTQTRSTRSSSLTFPPREPRQPKQRNPSSTRPSMHQAFGL